MKQTIYCDCFYCEHYEAGKCASPVLHLGNHSSCKEFFPSTEKMDAYIDTHSPSSDSDKSKEYGEYSAPHTIFRIRQK